MSNSGDEKSAEVHVLHKRIQSLERTLADLTHENALLRRGENAHNTVTSALSDYVYTVQFQNGKPVEAVHDMSCTHVTGFTPEEYQRLPDLWISMIPEEHKKTFLDFTETIAQGGFPGVCEHVIIRKDGERRWIRITPVLFYNSDGSIRSYKGYVNDIHEYKQVCEERDLSKQQLLQADKMKSLGVLVAGVAHEINNPNNLIAFNGDLLTRFWNELLNTQCIPEDVLIGAFSQQEFVSEFSKLIEGVKEGSFRIKNIVESLKDFAQGDSGKFRDTIDLNKVVDSSLFILSTLIKSHNVELVLTVEKRLPLVRGNFLQLEQVIINIISNACQSSTKKNIMVSIATQFKGDEVIVIVTDNGDGIPTSHMDSLLDPFFTTKREVGGTGLGLSISYGIIQKHGGEMQFDSVEGEGTTVAVSLPELQEGL
ncbi:MAG: ATP-binding protein [Fibrobacterales bacterium]